MGSGGWSMMASSFANACDLCNSTGNSTEMGPCGPACRRGMSESAVDAEVMPDIPECLTRLRRGGFGTLRRGATAMGGGRHMGLNSASRSTFGAETTPGDGDAEGPGSSLNVGRSSAAVVAMDGLRRLGSRRGSGRLTIRKGAVPTSRVVDGGRRFGSRRGTVTCEEGRARVRISGVPITLSE